MIIELDSGDFRIAWSHLGSRIRSPEAGAVLLGNNPGWVFVDDTTRPSTALIWARGIQGFYFVGEPSNSAFLDNLDRFVDRLIAPRLRQMGLEWLEVSGGEGWDPFIEQVFARRSLEKGLQWVYALDPEIFKRQSSNREMGPHVRKVDRGLIHEAGLAGLDFLVSKISSFWGKVDNFLRIGLGFVLIEQDEIASACLSGFVSQATHAIDIYTLEDHRRKGYAEAVAGRYLDTCTKRGLNPYWDCMAENLPSAKLAEKLGFTKAGEYNLYSFQLGSGGGRSQSA
jgi:GNAT superfamily N-acetyltransferase